jgi:hypothetical protein
MERSAENTHQIDPATRAVYVDNEAAVIAHSEVLLAGDGLGRLVSADIVQLAQVLGPAQHDLALWLSDSHT